MRISTGCLVVGLSGFVALSFEILWARIGAVGSADSSSMFGLLLGWYLLGLAVGAGQARRWCRSGEEVPERIGWLLAGASVVALSVAPTMAWGAAAGTWTLALPLVALAAAGLGAMFPLVAQDAVAPGEDAGQGVSWLLASNILGSALGSWLTGFFLLDHLGVSQLAPLLSALGLAVAAMLAARTAQRIVVLVLAGVVLTQGDRLGDDLWEQLTFRQAYEQGQRFSYVKESRSGVVMVTKEDMVLGTGIYDGYVDTDLVNDRNMIVRAYGMAAVHPDPKEVLVIGMSMGAWTKVLVNMPGVERVTVVEINEGYLELMEQFPLVSGLLDHPKVDIHVDDGRRWLGAHPERRFDLVVANVSYHWRANASVILSREFMEIVQAHLAEGGVFHFNTTWSGDVFATAFDVFEYGFRFINFATVSDVPMRFDKDRFRDSLAAWRMDGEPIYNPENPQHLARIDEVVSMADDLSAQGEMVVEGRESVLARLVDPVIVTDDNMECEWTR